MSNSFNISVKPEIAAAVVKIDANKAVIDNIHDVDLPAAKTVIDSNSTIISDIHDTDLPAAKTVIDSNSTIITDIHDTDLPGAVSKIDVIDGIVDSILLSSAYSTFVSDDLLSSMDIERVNTNGITYAKVKECIIGISGTYRVTFDMKTLNAIKDAYGQIYKSGVAEGTERMTAETSYQPFTEDIALVVGDLLQLYTKSEDVSNTCYIQNFRVHATSVNDAALVITD